MITIVDYGVGNLGSIRNMLNYLGVPNNLARSPADIELAERLLLPGVGSFDFGMAKLHESKLTEMLHRRVTQDKAPILGICLGMQIMCRSSAEGNLPGLGWFNADVLQFEVKNMNVKRPIPHMGWNEVEVRAEHPVLHGLPQNSRFYFVHSYHVVCHDPKDELLRAEYGYPFTAAMAQENRLAVQFHPEKSHKFGMTLLKNFAKWVYVQT
ncbi:MAG: imidazole glycerol phosphate synthase subunit HisH [Candidatus Accumulibacter meliphilus]|jgi:glutamine amidotransferase|uniref:Imidazole glycerol phosphate synthase subunit HisH n=1 Tax=Candidatus Accumulibacter meliphilus TaxID=2211374 RepID=A0A369XSI5_9PROT|nr:MAG: imidazole glycerol phosphate synthase subunit HisH [Candidatus Accumulibacter meliphilus]